MLPAGLALLVWLPAALGFGSFAPVEGGPLRRAGTAGLVGLAVLATVAVTLHLAVALSPAVSAAGLVAGWALFLRSRRRFLTGVRLVHLALTAALVLALAALAQPAERHYDSGLYLLQTVRWVKEHAQVRGLASVHPRLGYNSSWLALAALVEAPGLAGRASFFLNALPVLFLAFFAADAFGRLRARERRTSTFYFALGLFPALYSALSTGSVYPDEPVAVLTVVSIGFLVLALEEPERFVPRAAVGALLAAFAFTAKASAVVLVAAWAVFLASRARALDRPARLLFVAGAAAIFVPWAARGVLTSGCLLYPAAWSCVPALPWATPVDVVAVIADQIRAWSRWPEAPVDQALRGWEWLPGWLRGTSGDPLLAVAVGGIALGVAALRGSLVRIHEIRVPLVVIGSGIVFWFFTAPSPRFGMAYLLPAAILPVSAWAATRGSGGTRWGTWLAIGLTGAAAIVYVQRTTRPLRRMPSERFVLARWPEFPRAALDRRATAPGTEVFVPASGDQCWDARPPCTPWYVPGLEWRSGEFHAGSKQ